MGVSPVNFLGSFDGRPDRQLIPHQVQIISLRWPGHTFIDARFVQPGNYHFGPQLPLQLVKLRQLDNVAYCLTKRAEPPPDRHALERRERRAHPKNNRHPNSWPGSAFCFNLGFAGCPSSSITTPSTLYRA